MTESSTENTRPGTVCTFYSYKGGVGRSMAVANVGVVMAMEGLRVLLVDWDLEAPGLEVYFRNGARLVGDTQSVPGVLDLIESQAKEESLTWSACLLKAEFFGRSLDIISAGRRTDDYRRRVQQLDWDELFSKHRIGNYVSRLREEWRSSYDLVLVDSRTGITDIGDICTVLLPDILVLMFVANLQNVEGVKDTMARAIKARSKLPVNRSKLLGVPIPARDERDREYDKSVEWQQIYATSFSEMYREWLPKEVNPADALNKLYIPYVAAWSFGERLPVIESDRERHDPSSIGASYGRLATLLINRLDWYAIEAKASVGELVGTRVELSKAREEKQAAEARAATTVRRARVWTAGLAAVFVMFALGGVVWYQNRPEPVSTELFDGDRLRREGNLAEALLVFEARKTLLESNVAATPLDTNLQRDLLLVHNRIGDVLQSQGQLAEALRSFQAGKARVDNLLARDSGNTLWRSDLSVSHSWIGIVLEEQGRLDQALVSYQAGKAIMDELVARDPENNDWQRELALRHGRVGGILETQGKLGEALMSFEAYKAILEKIAARDPENTGWQFDLSVSHNRIGGVLEDQGRLREAEASFQAAKGIMEKLVAGDSANTVWQGNLAATHTWIGSVYHTQGKLNEALTSFQVAREIQTTLVAKDPENIDWQRSLAVTHHSIGLVLREQDKPAEALVSLQADRAIAHKLVASDPENTAWQRELSATLKVIGSVELDMQRPAEALKTLDLATEAANRSDPGSALARTDMIAIQQYRVRAHLALNDRKSARDACSLGRNAAGGAVIDDRNRFFWEPSVSALYVACAEVTASEGDLPGALREMTSAAARLRGFAAQSPDDDLIRRELTRAEKRIAELKTEIRPAARERN